MRSRELTQLETRLGHRFSDPALFERALTHSSYAHEENRGDDNEALEFLGDAVLGFLIAESLLKRFPEMDEGGLSKLKAFLVSRPNLAEVARGIGLGPCLRLGKTAERGQGRTKESLLSDALEAVIAAVHLDGGDAATRALVDRLFASQIERLDRVEVEGKDFKTSLQEILQAKGRPTPRYRIQATEGPPHRPLFHVDLLVEGELLARGSGGSKKEAEQRAARQALRSLASKRSGS